MTWGHLRVVTEELGISINAGSHYKLVFTVSDLSSGTADITFYNAGLGETYLAEESFANGTYTRYFTASSGGGFRFRSDTGSGSSFKVKDYSIKQLYQSADLSDTYPAIIDVNEPVEQQVITDTASNREFTNGTTTNWAEFYGSPSGTVAVNNTDDTLECTINGSSTRGGCKLNVATYGIGAVESGKTYKLSISAKCDDSSNTFRMSFGGLEQDQTLTSSFVTYTLTGTATSGTNEIFLFMTSVDSGALITIDNVSFQKYSGNVGIMTNQAADDLVYSSVLPDQSFLTGVDSAYNFFDNDATNEYIDCGTGIGTFLGDNYAGDLSISIWFKNAGANDDGLFDMGAGTGSGKLWISVGYQSKLWFNLNGGNWSRSVSFTDTSDWHHLVIVYKGGSESESLMYLDNSSVGATAGTFPSASDMDFGTNNKVAIATFWDRSAYAFDGSIGQTAIWNKALSATEVSAIYSLGRHANLLDKYADNLLGYWAMGALDALTGLSDVGNGTIYDRSGQSNHGTATNTEAADLASSPNADPNGYAKGDTNRSTTIP
jgi:hypothetical protein